MSAEPRDILDMNAFDGDADGEDDDTLLNRRIRNVGGASVLFYKQPIEMVRRRGCWFAPADGTHYLDFYNNILSVGHCHPGVVAAIRHQLGELNVNSRYLSATTELYPERPKATRPARLSNILLACSGSEANDLAIRVAKIETGCTGSIVTKTAYHSNTSAVLELSPAAFKRG
jgi:4-aminobutyrate aminotransferase-like enzyme